MLWYLLYRTEDDLTFRKLHREISAAEKRNNFYILRAQDGLTASIRRQCLIRPNLSFFGAILVAALVYLTGLLLACNVGGWSCLVLLIAKLAMYFVFFGYLLQSSWSSFSEKDRWAAGANYLKVNVAEAEVRLKRGIEHLEKYKSWSNKLIPLLTTTFAVVASLASLPQPPFGASIVAVTGIICCLPLLLQLILIDVPHRHLKKILEQL